MASSADIDVRTLRALFWLGGVLWLAAGVTEMFAGRMMPTGGLVGLRLLMGVGAALLAFSFFRSMARHMERSNELPRVLRKPVASFARLSAIVFALAALILPVVQLLIQFGAAPSKGLTP